MNKKQIWITVGVLVAVIAIVGVVVAASSDNAEDTSSQSASDMNMSEGEQSNTNDSGNSTSSNDTQNSSQASQTNSVTIADYAYGPSTITVKVGAKVTWTNNDTVRHDVMADNPSSDAPSSELLAKGESYSFTFNKAGTYSYHCTPHPYMKGKVIVTE